MGRGRTCFGKWRGAEEQLISIKDYHASDVGLYLGEVGARRALDPDEELQGKVRESIKRAKELVREAKFMLGQQKDSKPKPEKPPPEDVEA